MVLKKVGIKEDVNFTSKDTPEMTLALKNTLKILLEHGFDPDLGLYLFKGSASDIVVDISLLEGKWFCFMQRIDNRK